MSLTNLQYDQLMRQYQQRQTEHRHEMELHIREIYEKFPEFSAIDEKIAAASTSCARQIMDGDFSPLTALKQNIVALSLQKKQRLTDAGYPSDYLELHYTCPDCQDSGYINGEKCHCFRQAITDLLYRQSNLTNLIGNDCFAAFSLDYYSEELRDPATGLNARETARGALEQCIAFAQNFDQRGGNLFLYGDTGLGKTFLSHCIARELMDSTHSVVYFTASRLFELLADSAFRRSDSDLEQPIYDCDLLIIDDLGTEIPSSFVNSQLFLVLNERMLRKRSTLISTNLSLQTMAKLYSERIFSRITSNYTLLKLIGDDIRIQKKISGQKP